jgi:hypothetical protein
MSACRVSGSFVLADLVDRRPAPAASKPVKRGDQRLLDSSKIRVKRDG